MGASHFPYSLLSSHQSTPRLDSSPKLRGLQLWRGSKAGPKDASKKGTLPGVELDASSHLLHPVDVTHPDFLPPSVLSVRFAPGHRGPPMEDGSTCERGAHLFWAVTQDPRGISRRVRRHRACSAIAFGQPCGCGALARRSLGRLGRPRPCSLRRKKG